jgi:glutamate-ammonia-ligase adenylyltransferase
VSLPAFQAYFAGEAETWERMALTRARVVWADSENFGVRVSSVLEQVLRSSAEPSSLARDAAAMRALLEGEKAAGSPWDLKHAPGGLVDVEFSAQLGQLAGAGKGGPLRPGTAEALDALVQAGFLPARPASELAAAWRLQAGLSQLIAAALEPGSDPSAEPRPFRRKLARAGGVRSFTALEAKLRRVQAATRRAWLTVVRTTEAHASRVEGARDHAF